MNFLIIRKIRAFRTFCQKYFENGFRYVKIKSAAVCRAFYFLADH